MCFPLPGPFPPGKCNHAPSARAGAAVRAPVHAAAHPIAVRLVKAFTAYTTTRYTGPPPMTTRMAHTRRGFLAASLALGAAPATSRGQTAHRKPNVVVILADDITAVWKSVIYFRRGNNVPALDEADEAARPRL